MYYEGGMDGYEMEEDKLYEPCYIFYTKQRQSKTLKHLSHR